jgi:hypothetical protein
MAAARVGCVSVGTGAESEVESSVKYGRGGDTLRSQFLVPCSLRPVVSFFGGRGLRFRYCFAGADGLVWFRAAVGTVVMNVDDER